MSPRRRARSGEPAVGETRREGRGRRGQLYHAVILSTRAPRRDEPPEPAPTRRLPGARRPPVSGAAVLADPGSRRARGRRGAATIRAVAAGQGVGRARAGDRKSTRLNSSHITSSYAVFCLKKKNKLGRVL